MSQHPELGVGMPARIADLVEALPHLLELAQQGEWEGITAYCDKLQPILTAIENIESNSNKDPALSPEAIREAMALLHLATEKCSERLAQIAPLIHALAPLKQD